MAGRSNGRPNDRDLAYNNIFGSLPPRSQTMTSSTFPNVVPQGRTHTMGGAPPPGMANGMQRQPPPRQQQQPNGYGPAPPMNGNMPNGGNMQNGYYAGQRQQVGGQVQSQPQPQFLPQPSRPDRRYGGGGPQRIEQRGPHPQYPTTRPIPQRYGPTPTPALNSDPYRSQSMASVPRPTFNAPPSTYNQQAPANAFRQAPYQQSSGTTAQGRIVPQRHDERSMSMTRHPQDREIQPHQQMSSGRVIPARRTSQSSPTELQGSNGYDYGRSMSMASTTVSDMSRSMSMASTIMPSDRTDSLSHRPSITKSVSSGTGGRHKVPLVYPALLSKVGECFRRRITMEDKVGPDGLIWTNAFTGSEAVDMLAYIIKTTDRNLALLLGRSLDAQRFFHHVTYEHRLRDSAVELYKFQDTVMDGQSDGPEVNGVFVLLSECYSPTCTKDALCYSIACPKRLEQQSRLNLKPQGGLRRQESQASLHDEVDELDEQKLWINTVSQDVANSVSDKEKKRQEVISELMYTERDFVKDMEYLRDFWITPLRMGTANMPSPIPEPRRDKIVRTVFSNIIDHPSIHAVSSKFAEALTERQKSQPVVYQVGDIVLEYAQKFQPFILYGSNQLAAKHEFEKEKNLNTYFAKFVDETERRKESRKLELNGYLTKPTTRLARYPLLLENILKYTEDGNPDKVNIPKATEIIRDFLSKVNEESGKAENRFNLKQLHENLRFKPNERVDLKLTEEGRMLLLKAPLKKAPNDPTDITAYLFDHAILFVRTKMVGKKEEVKVFRRPIPLELLHIREMEEVMPSMGISKRPSSSLLPKNNVADNSKKDFPITFAKVGRNNYEITLYATTPGSRKKWLEAIGTQQQLLRTKGDFYNKNEISTGFFSANNRVNCVAPFDGGRKLIYGTDTGIYVSDRRSKDATVKPRKALEAQNVVQIDVLEEYQLILVLANKSLHSYALSALDPNEAALNKRPKKIQGHCNFFKTGVCLGRHLVCCVKSSALSTTIKVFEPNDAMSRGKKQKNFFNLKTGGPDELKSFKEFYIPTESSSIHFLKSKLCVACARGFEVVSLETLETQSLLDQADTSLDFVARKEGNIRPIHIERLNGEFLLNYSDFSFFVNRNGWRARPEWRIDWEGQPQNFALMYPWILAFEPNFIEIRNIELNTVHIIQGKNIRMLHSSTREILYAYEDDRGGDTVASIDFWPAEQQTSHPPRSASQAPPTQGRR